MIVLAEAVHQMPASASLRDLAAAVEMARLAGCRVYDSAGLWNPLQAAVAVKPGSA